MKNNFKVSKSDWTLPLGTGARKCLSSHTWDWIWRCGSSWKGVCRSPGLTSDPSCSLFWNPYASPSSPGWAAAFSGVFSSWVPVRTPEHPCPGRRLPVALQVVSELERSEAPGGCLAGCGGWYAARQGWCHSPSWAEAGLGCGVLAGFGNSGHRTQTGTGESVGGGAGCICCAPRRIGRRTGSVRPVVSERWRWVFRSIPLGSPAAANPGWGTCSAWDCTAHRVTRYLRCFFWKKSPEALTF